LAQGLPPCEFLALAAQAQGVWENSGLRIVSTGIYYALAFLAGAGLVAWLAGPWFAVPLVLLAAFCLNFFRDPDREIPQGPVAVSPADGRVLAVVPETPQRTRVTIFLNVFDVHVNRTPVAGRIEKVEYKTGRFLVASKEACSTDNEQNVVTVTGDGVTVVFKQIAGLIARRIIFTKQPGDTVALGERIGLMRFGSRMDVLFGREWEILVRTGQRVVAGSTVIARRIDREQPHGA
jgi:phosphatidylserine decarboxylase